MCRHWNGPLKRGSYSDRPMTIYSNADIGLEKNVERETGWERSLFPIKRAEQTVKPDMPGSACLAH